MDTIKPIIMTEDPEGWLAPVLLLNPTAVFAVMIQIVQKFPVPLQRCTHCFAISLEFTSEGEWERLAAFEL